MVLKPVSHLAGVRALIDLKAVRDPVPIKNVVQLACVHAQAVLVSDVDRDCAELTQISDVLIDEGQRRILPSIWQEHPAGVGRPSSADRDKAADSWDQATTPPHSQAWREERTAALPNLLASLLIPELCPALDSVMRPVEPISNMGS